MAGAGPGHVGLVVEELGPDDSFTPVARRVLQLLRGGVREVWLIDPETRSVAIYGADGELVVMKERHEERGLDTLSRLGCRVGDLVGPRRGGEVKQ